MAATLTFSENQVRMLRMRAQRLVPGLGRLPRVARLVQDLYGVQAQDPSAAALAVRVRRAGLVQADVVRARVEERSIVRTWCMRGTLHLVATKDLGWLLALLGPIFIQANRGRRAELGLDQETGESGVRALRRLLRDRGPQTRAEIVEQLAGRGIRLVGQAAPHLLGLAALAGVICLGPDRGDQGRGREPTYVLLEDWADVGPALPPEKARAELARRYLAAYAPATPEDMAAWSGLALGEARAAWEQNSTRLIEVRIGESPAWILKTQADWLDDEPPPGPIVRLLPAFDTYLLGYRSREFIWPAGEKAASIAKRVYPGGGMLRPALLVDGTARGTWKIERRRNGSSVLVEAMDDLGAEARQGLEAEVADLGHFLGEEMVLKITSVE